MKKILFAFLFVLAIKTNAQTFSARVNSVGVTSLGTVGTGTWQAGVIGSTYGGTGINNGGRTLTINTNSGTVGFSNASKTFTIANTLTLSGTDGSTLNVGAGGTLGTNAYTSTAYAPLASPTFTGTVTIPTPFTLGATSVTSTGTQLNYLNAATGTTGTTSTNLVFSTSPTLVTPVLGVATATSINGNTFTTGTYTLTGAAGKTLTFNNSLTLAGTDATVMTFPSTSATIARTDNINTFTGVQTFSSLPVFSVPLTTLGTIGTGVWQGTLVAGQFGGTGVNNSGKTITVSGNTTIGSTTNTVAFATSGNTSVTLPASGTILSSVTAPAANPVTGTPTASNYLRGDGTWSTPAGSGDMVLADVQTVTGAKTFNDTRLLLRNVANTFNGSFTNTNTADRIYTLPDRAFTLDNITTSTTTNITGLIRGNGTAVSAATANTDYIVGGTTISPAQITSDQNNYNPSGFDDADVIRISGDNGIRAITSLAAPTTAAKPMSRTIINTGGFPIYFPAEHPSGTAANRFTGTEDFMLHPYKSTNVIYDETSTRWRTIGRDVPLATNTVFFNYNAGSVTAGDFGNVTFLTIGTGTITPTAATTTLPSSALMSTAAASTSGYMVYFNRTTVTYSAFGTGHNWAESILSIPNLSDGTETYALYLQITATPSSTTANVNNNVGIRYSSTINSGKWELYSKDNAGAESVADLGITVATATLYKLRIEINKARTEARAYINDQYVGRVTGNMPNAVVVGSRVLVLKSAGTTARTVALHNMSGGAIHAY